MYWVYYIDQKLVYSLGGKIARILSGSLVVSCQMIECILQGLIALRLKAIALRLQPLLFGPFSSLG